ncbi:cell surface glycoprotein [Streptomyces sp. NBC_00124]|uniref:zinc finger domain-containing protein n=1 Tax=Streptomyces sp. NBC_00124 TaxID=2975662 RepID=UPI00225387EC|nr:cell surface glycoprotein [Streptomyces sp. NBC_00124]MCX5362906.1 cell surface glycoprotein [Streptomyces sp. NBC_00124]
MTPREVAALLAYVVKLDPRLSLDDQTAAADRLAQWCDLLSDVPAQAHGWDAARVVRDHIARSPYRIQPSDVSRPWHVHKADVLGRHAGTFEPTRHPEVDPDDEYGNAYVAALRAERRAVAAGQATPYTSRAITAGTLAAQVERRLAQLGRYMPPTVAEALADYRPHRAEREQLAAEGLPDPLDVACPYEHCLAPVGDPCRNARRVARGKPHPSRIDAATVTHYAHQEAAA